jgi:hypothetical protein
MTDDGSGSAPCELDDEDDVALGDEEDNDAPAPPPPPATKQRRARRRSRAATPIIVNCYYCSYEVVRETARSRGWQICERQAIGPQLGELCKVTSSFRFRATEPFASRCCRVVSRRGNKIARLASRGRFGITATTTTRSAPALRRRAFIAPRSTTA